MPQPPGAAPATGVLVVDDERLIRWMLRQVLERAGFRVVEAEDAGEALRVFAADPDVEAVVLDLKLPDGDGISVLRGMKAARRDCRVIIMTAHGSLEDEQAAMNEGAFRFVLKPFDPRAMLATVQEALAPPA